MTKELLKKKAIDLRHRGYSYGLIQEKVSVSKSTLSLWLSDVPYTPNRKVVERIGKARARSGKVKSKMKRDSIRTARKEARGIVGSFTDRDLLMLGIGLYIGEGEKTSQIIRVTNSDPRVIMLSMRWLMSAFGLSIKNFSLTVHLYPDNDIEESLSYWSNVTGIPRNQFGKTQIDRRKNKKVSKRGKLPHGTAHLIVKGRGKKEFGVFLFRQIEAMMEESFNQCI